MTDYKSGVLKAMEKYHQKQLPNNKPKKKNEKPEKQTEKEVLQLLRSKGWFVEVVESKAVFSQAAGRFLRGQATTGFVDIVGCTSSGQSVAIELKALGRRSSLREQQREFLNQVICRGGFGCVVDSAAFLESLHRAYLANPRPETLSDFLPKKKKLRDQDSFSFT